MRKAVDESFGHAAMLKCVGSAITNENCLLRDIKRD
jgi:hypothetical protein